MKFQKTNRKKVYTKKEYLSLSIPSAEIGEWDKITIDYYTPKQILNMASHSCHGWLRSKVIEQTSKRKVYCFYCPTCKKELAKKVVFPC